MLARAAFDTSRFEVSAVFPGRGAALLRKDATDAEAAGARSAAFAAFVLALLRRVARALHVAVAVFTGNIVELDYAKW